MKMKNMFAYAMLAFGVVAVPFAGVGDTTGDIYEIEKLTGDYGISVDWPSATDPITVGGQEIRFAVHLLAKDATENPGAACTKWYLEHVGTGSEAADDAFFPLKIGIVVSGKLRWATLVDTYDNDERPYVYTGEHKGYEAIYDAVFSYTVQPGDYAMPIRLALAGSTEDNPIAAFGASGNFMFQNADKWWFKNADGDICTFALATDDRRSNAQDRENGWKSPYSDLTLADSGFYVRTVNFTNPDPADWEEPGSYWRSVESGSGQTAMPATLAVNLLKDDKLKVMSRLYVWTTNDTVVTMNGGVKTMMGLPPDGSVTQECMVAAININTSFDTYTIPLWGGEVSEVPVDVFVSQYAGFRYDSAGALVADFIHVPVLCKKPPNPNLQVCFDPMYPMSSKSKTVDTSMKTTENLAEDAIPLYLELSEAYSNDLTVLIAITNVGQAVVDPISNRNISVSQYGDSFTETDMAYTNVTIKAGDKEAVVYVYPLGGDNFTQSQGISFTPVITDAVAKGHYEVGIRALLKVKSAHKPTVTSSMSDTDDPQDANGFQVPVQVQDCYRDLKHPKGFKVDVDFSDGSKMNQTNIIFNENAETMIPLSGYGVNAKYANIKVTEPDGNAYGTIRINFTVKPQKTIMAALYDSTDEGSLHVGTTFTEGSTPIVRFAISENLAFGSDRYAFLVPQNAASSNLVECQAFSNGVLIPGGLTNSALNVHWALKLKDGCAESDGSTGTLSYKIAFRTADKLTEGEADPSYTDVAGLQFTVANKLPELNGVYVNGNPNSVKRGEHYANPLPCDNDIDFGFKNADASSVDVSSGLITIWCFTEGRTSTSWKYKAIVTNATTAILQHKFTYPGVTQEVQVVTLDKDILHSLTNGTGRIDFAKESDLKALWPRIVDYIEPFSFTVAISTKPHIVVEPFGFSTTEQYGDTMDETGNGKRAKIRVSLSDPADEQLKLRLIAKPGAEDDPGTVEFDTTTQPVDPEDPSRGYYTLLTIAADQTEPARSSSYVLNEGLKFKYSTLNGTAGSEGSGWELIAEVVKDDGEGGWIADESKYAKSEGTMITVLNLPPTVTPAQPEVPTTNKTVTLGKAFEIVWTPGDVQADMKAVWTGTEYVGLKCEWYVNDNQQVDKTTYVTYTPDTTKVAQQTTSITLNDEGLSVVKLVITDIDGADYHGQTERTWFYYISPSKKLSITPVGPAGNTKTRYLAQSGLGRGRVWANGGTVQLAAFNQTWSYNIQANEATVFAYGYPGTETSYPDDGTLGPGARDVAIDPDGEAVEPGLSADKYYNYDQPYDNFFYRWVYILSGEKGGGASVEYGILQPTAKTNATTQEPIALDPYDAKKESYDTRRLEAVFSREYLLSDNLGDLNGDGVPDIYLRHYLDLGICDEIGTVVGNDLAKLGGANPDEDYLPNTLTAQYAAFIPGLSNSWVMAGRAFTTRLEIRGFGDTLNNAPAQAGVAGTPDIFYADPTVETNSTLTLLEWTAYTNWCDRAGITNAVDVTNRTTWAKWSPERPTDPTEADTDGDGLPDGYEYYFWYLSHVGKLDAVVGPGGKATTNYVRMTGHRYNPYDPGNPGIISADEIEKIFDPLKPFNWDDTTDTDNDGLPDLIEFMIGTNPVEYDTDGDMLPDGYEIYRSFTDPLKPGEADLRDPDRNDDGDAMAIGSITMIPVYVAYTNSVAGNITNSLQQTNTLWAMATDAWRLTNLVERTGGDFGEGTYSNLVDGVDLYSSWNYYGRALGKIAETVESSKKLVIYSVGGTNALTTVHYQVYGVNGFDPRTAWKSSESVRSAPYTVYDEFMSLAFFYQTGGLADEDLVPTDEHPWTWIWTEYSTNPNNADTDNDNVPDGWEFYTMGGPQVISGLSPKHPLSPLMNFRKTEMGDADGDGLDHEAEWCGTTCCAAYPTLFNCQPDWTNKTQPTDPWNGDTDGDGIPDGGEKTCLEGGGLNPLSWDTDGDGLPDPWELEFCGTWSEGTSETKVTETTDGTNGTQVVTNTVTTAATFNNDGMNPTASDAMLDYDNDGLANWQEYMVGAMRCWRYDDPASQWGSHEFDAFGGLPSEDDAKAWGEFWYKRLIDTQDAAFNPHLRNGWFDPGVYFSCCTNEWDGVAGRYYMFADGVYHDLQTPPDDMYWIGEPGAEGSIHLNRFTYKPYQEGIISYTLFEPGTRTPICPKHYICCNPKEPDTDFDGMDDYYELYHGLNPILGYSGRMKEGRLPFDVVHDAYGISVARGGIYAEANYWTETVDPRIKPGSESGLYDFEKFPWLAGLAQADPDGDNHRNQLEAIMPNVQAASNYLHTDPTPLWMTDSNDGNSLTRRYYIPGRGSLFSFASSTGGFTDPNGKWHNFTDFPGFTLDEKNKRITYRYNVNNWDVIEYFADFEENEGYDSDGDYLSDWEEATGKTKSASDPQDVDSPLRRQAMWFGGAEDKSFLQTPLPVEELDETHEMREEFLYYTVECWAKPDAATYKKDGLQTLVERVLYTGESGPADQKFLRKNFLIGIRNGRWYTKYDSNGTDSSQPVEITDGPEVTTEWTHVAATYDGTALRLYVNGACNNVKDSGVKPQCSTFALAIDEDGEAAGKLFMREVSIIVGASAATPAGIIFDNYWRTGVPTTFDDYDSYYRGYIDEVRIWDGARTEDEIITDYTKRTRYTAEQVAANRAAVFAALQAGGARAPTPGVQVDVPAELFYHFAFDHIPGAVLATDLMKVPAGFSTKGSVTDAKALWVRPEGWVSPWWASVSVGSTVYTDRAWEPWIINTVAHLAREDGSTLDSIYWSESAAGALSAADAGFISFSFPRTHEVFTRRTQMEYTNGTGTPRPSHGSLTQFAYRNRNVMGDDMMPMGGAYPRRISAAEGGMWDDAPGEPTAADAWAQTGVDEDNNGLPDWWESYARVHYGKNLEKGVKIRWETMLDYNGLPLTAGEAYLRDLARGMVRVDGKTVEILGDYADMRDLDKDGMPDWWEELYGIDTQSAADANADPDHDGLSNIQEYRIAQRDGLYLLNPNLARSFVGQAETDYFLPMPEGKGHDGEYLGEVYADHDFMEDDNEDLIGTDRTRYDAYSDNDEDGWTAWSELRYSTFKMSRVARFVSHMNGGEEVVDSPIPVVHMNLRYNGERVPQGSTAPIVVQAYAGGNLQKNPAAVWTITPGEVRENCALYLGAWSAGTYHGTLTPGHVLAGFEKISLQCAYVQQNDKYSWTNGGMNFSGTYAEMAAAYIADPENVKVSNVDFTWADVIDTSDGSKALQLTIDDQTQKGYLLLLKERVGEIDFVTGDFTLSLKRLKGYFMEGDNIDLTQYFFRLVYSVQVPTLQTRNLSASLALPDTGLLKEGTASFVAFVDLGGDGAFTPGEPIGIARDVEIGWDQVPGLTIEMTDDSQAAGKRLDASAAGNDTVRIIRTTINGEETLNGVAVKRRIVYSRDASLMDRQTIYEGDLVTASKFGLDWAALRSDIGRMGLQAKDVSEVGYIVTRGEGSVLNVADGDVIDRFTVSYQSTQLKPNCVSPSVKSDGIVQTSRPTFRWTGTDDNTAFMLQIADAAGTVVWSNDMQVLPPRDTALAYTFTAPVFIGRNVLGATNDLWILENGSNYQWHVAMFNAKYSSPADAVWSDWAAFRTELVEQNDMTSSYGNARVTVRYFGPATNDLSSVVVRLYRTADFTGVPVAQTRLWDVEGSAQALTDAVHTVTFSGLASGDYYAMAFIDRNGNVTRDRWETWGYANQVGLGLQAIYTPVALAVDAQRAEVPSVTVIMEDTDLNKDGELDCRQPDEEKFFRSVVAGPSGADETDVDVDGLTGDEEMSDTYTKPQKWDTDGDKMPDGWEARFADLDPLSFDADVVASGDVMAFATEPGKLVSDAAGVTYLLMAPAGVTYRTGDVVTNAHLCTTYDYATVIGEGTNVTTVTYCGVGTNLVGEAATFKIDEQKDVTVAYVHAQVYDRYGYSLKTAIPQDGAIRTKPFTALDKYMVVRYLAAMGLADEEVMNLNKTDGKRWANWTLKPMRADNDRDGMLDGWELYVMFGTNGCGFVTNGVGQVVRATSISQVEISPWNPGDRSRDLDGDGLSNVEENCDGNDPSDPWNKYSVYESLVAEGVIPPTTEKFDDKVRRFGIGASELDDDWDIDLVSNGQEMWSYYIDYANKSTLLADIDPKNAWSDGTTPDYFRTFVEKPGVTNYLGAYYNGAEFIEPYVRTLFDITDLSRAGTRDLYHSGWDVWSIVRSSIKIQEESGQGGVSEELSVANKFTYVTFSDYTGATEEELTAYHKEKCPSCRRDAEVGLSLEDVISLHGGLDEMKRIVREHASDSLDVAGFAIPEPKINLTLKYAGQNQHDIIVDAYQVNSAYPEYGEQLTASWAMPVAFDAGLGYAKMELAARGTLKQGKTRFVAYIDKDGSGTFSAGDTYGEAEAYVGYLGCDLTMRLGEASTALPVIDVNVSSNAIQTVAIVRTKVNGQYLKEPRGVMLRRYENNVNRTALYPSDFVSDDYIGIDPYLADDIDEGEGEAVSPESIESVTYEIVRIPRAWAKESEDGEGYVISNTNLNHYTYAVEIEDPDTGDVSNVYYTVDQQVNETFTVYYSNTRDIPLEVKGEAASKAGDTLISFAVPKDRAVTKFWIKIDNVDGKFKDRGYLLPNLADGRVVLDQQWFVDNGFAPALTSGVHTVRVALGNDKFPEAPGDGEWSAPAEFAVAADTAFEGELAVVVEHPTADLDSQITIAVYEKADLANPVAVTNNCAQGATVEIGGLRPGAAYYVAAWYVKDAKDGRESANERLPYDTWGYLTMLGEKENGFDAKPVTAIVSPVTTNLVFLQDTDWNDNGIVDRLEKLKSKAGVKPSKAPEWDPLDVDGDDIVDPDDPDPVFDNSGDWIEGDVMAYQVKRMLCVQIGTVGIETNWTWYAVMDPKAEPYRLSGDTVIIPRGTAATNLTTLCSIYLYGRKKNSPYGLGTNVTLTAGEVYHYDWMDVVLVHNQVYKENGFNPNTANALISEADWVNTKKFTRLDKYIVTNYLAAVGALAPNTDWSKWVLRESNKKTKWNIDFDFDGIPDGWELYTMFGPKPVKTLTKEPVEDVLNAWVDDDRAFDPDDDKLANVYEYDGGHFPTDPWNADTDGDGVIDWYAFQYHLKGDEAGKDLDGDGLSDYAEYLISEVFQLAKVNPDKAHTSDGVLDYFRKQGELYLGEIFTDHDHMTDAVEDLFPEINRYVYDAHLDGDVDGWSNWAEVCASVAAGTTEAWYPVTNGTTVVSNRIEVSAYTGRPQPELRLKLRYGGVQDIVGASVVIKAYTQAEAFQPDAVFVVTNAIVNVGYNELTVKVPDSGYLREGANTFFVYLAEMGEEVNTKDGDKDSGKESSGSTDANDYVAGAPFAVMRDVDVGWSAVNIDVQLTDTDPSFARVPFAYAAGNSDREAIWGGSTTMVETNKQGKTTMHYGSSDVEINPDYTGDISALLNTKLTHIRVKRARVDGQKATQGSLNHRVIYDKYVPTDLRSFICEYDVIGAGEFDIDWANFDEVLEDDTVFGHNLPVTQVVYRVCIGEGEFNINGTTNVYDEPWIEVSRRFELNRTTPVATADSGVFYSARPTLTWTMGDGGNPRAGDTYSAFRVVITPAKGGAIDSGLMLRPVRDAKGRYSWTGPVLPPGDYTWKVSMYNAKFQSDAFSNVGKFSMATDLQQEMNDHGYGMFGVAVKYAGPAKVLASGKVHVEAYDTPDFSGEPLSETILPANTASLAVLASPTANCEVAGLRMGGTYYFRAYIDTNGNGRRDIWESWGYAKANNSDSVAQAVVLAGVTSPVVGIFIEDCDTDQDWLPDAWEMAKNKSLDTQGASVDPEGKIVFRGSTYEGLAGISTGLPGASFTVFNNLTVAKEMLGLSGEITIDAIREAVEKKIVKNSVKITALTFDQAHGKVILNVDAEVAETVAGALLSKFYTVSSPDTVTVKVKVYKVESLAEAWPDDPVVTQTVEFGAGAQEVEVNLGAGDFTSGFFKIEVEQ